MVHFLLKDIIPLNYVKLCSWLRTPSVVIYIVIKFIFPKISITSCLFFFLKLNDFIHYYFFFRMWLLVKCYQSFMFLFSNFFFLSTWPSFDFTIPDLSPLIGGTFVFWWKYCRTRSLYVPCCVVIHESRSWDTFFCTCISFCHWRVTAINVSSVLAVRSWFAVSNALA